MSAPTPPTARPEEEEEPRPPAQRWLAWVLIACAAAAALWLAALPLDELVPAPPPTRALVPEPPPAPLPAPETAPVEPLAPVPLEEGAPPTTVTLEPPPPPTDWFEEAPGEGVEPPSAHEALRDRLQRQLAMNDLHGVRVEIADDRIVTSGVVAQPGDRQRLALIVRSLAPDRVHEDHAEVGGRR